MHARLTAADAPPCTYTHPQKCAKCKPGFVSDFGSSVCAACAAEHYAVDGRACEPCPEGSTTGGRVAQKRCVAIKIKPVKSAAPKPQYQG